MVSKAYAKSFADHSFGNIRSIYQYEQQEPLTETAIQMILGTRSLHKRKVTLKTDKLSQYFDEHYSSEEIENFILQLLDEWKKAQEDIQ